MLDALAWYLVLAVLGLAALPAVSVVCQRLPDRGFALARPVGMLLTAYALWLLATFGVVQNTRAAAWGIVLAVGLACWIGFRRQIPAILETILARWRYVVAAEALFAVAFAAWSVVRSLMPDISATEKPMELAFLNAAFRNQTYPPMDPWLSGYSISYYYFGYVITAMLCQLTGIATSVGFNVMIATLFGLTVTGAFSVAYNMVSTQSESRGEQLRDLPGILTGVAASAFTVLLANLEGALEIAHAHGLGSPEFWAAVGIRDLSRPYVSGLWRPTEPPDTWWWFRASRVVATYGADGNARDYTINEFPFFSFLLADLHPHVLALPFAFVALSLALNAALGGSKVATWLPYRWIKANPVEALSVGFVAGALGFLNAWDLPTYLFLIAVGFTIGRARTTALGPKVVLGDVIRIGWNGGVLAVVLYLPFYVGFRNQASGIGIVGLRSQLQHFLIFWGPMLFFAVTGLVLLWRRALARVGSRSHGWTVAWWVILAIAFVLLALPVLGVPASKELPLPTILAELLRLSPAGGTPSVQIPIQGSALAILLPLTLMATETLFASSAARIEAPVAVPGSAPTTATRDSIGARTFGAATLPVGAVFAIALTGTGLLLLCVTELVFIRDLFNNRMNTVFKLYYQAWVVFALGSAYAVYYVASKWLPCARDVLGWLGRGAWLVAGVVLVVGATVYDPAALESRAASFSGPQTLDGTAYVERYSPGDYDAIRWLWQNAQGRPVIVEATGGSYTQFARISSATGLPTILGWAFHETQWRGTSEGQDKRRADIETIYRSGNRAVVLDLLRAYDVTFVYVGSLELETYGRPSRAGIDSLATFLDTAYKAGGVTIYKVRR